MESGDHSTDAGISIKDLYHELKQIAKMRMIGQPAGQTIQATVLAHEAWLKLTRNQKDWNDRQHFLSSASIAMRHILVDNARRKARLRHGGELFRAEESIIEQIEFPIPDKLVLLVDEAVEELEKKDRFRAQIVMARFFVGLSNGEIAQELDVSEKTVERHWQAAKVWLYRWVTKETKG